MRTRASRTAHTVALIAILGGGAMLDTRRKVRVDAGPTDGDRERLRAAEAKRARKAAKLKGK